MKETSLIAYHRLRDSGKLSERQIQVLTELTYNGPMTGQEVARKVPSGWKRLSELERLGAIKEIARRQCTVTGELAGVWAIIEDQPEPDQASLL